MGQTRRCVCSEAWKEPSECEQFPEEWNCPGGRCPGQGQGKPAQETTPFSPYFRTSSHSQSSYSGKRCISENPFGPLLLLFFFISDYKVTLVST